MPSGSNTWGGAIGFADKIFVSPQDIHNWYIHDNSFSINLLRGQYSYRM
jgi:hypothetical protein